jgi:hypothetical protein
MPHTLRPLSLGQLLDETFNIYRKHFLLFVGISAVPNILLLVLQLVLVGLAIQQRESIGIAALFAGLLTLFASIFVGSIVTSATTFAVSDIYLDNPTSLMACFARVGNKALKVFFVSFMFGLLVGLGSLFCLIPGIWAAGVYGLAIPAVVLESIPSTEAMNRSSFLTKDSVGRIIIVYLLTLIFTFAMIFALEGALSMLESTLFHSPGTISRRVMHQFISTLGGSLLGPISAIALTLLYYDQRVRKEAFDIEHMMQLMSAPETSI